MSRTQGRWDADTLQPDGQIFVSALSGVSTSPSGTVAVTKNASGDYSVNLSASSGSTFIIPVAPLLLRFGAQDWLQEQFGSSRAGGAQGLPIGGYTTLSTATTAAGTPVNIAVLSSVGFAVGKAVLIDTVASTVQEYAYITAIPDATHITVNTLVNAHTTPFPISQNVFTTPAGVTGPPPYTGITQLTPVTAPRPKGIKIKQITPVYEIAGAAATTNTIGITKTVFANDVAAVVTAIIADAANGLATATQTTPYATPIPVPIANQVFLTSQLTSVNIEWDVATTTGGTMRLYGVFLNVDLNYN